jgi:hypothetical protein
MGAQVAAGELCHDGLVQDRGVDGRREQRLGQLHRTGLGAGLGEQGGGDGHR